MSDPTTARAQRRQAVRDGSASDAVDRRSDRTNPRGRGSETTSRQRQQTARREIADDIDIDRDGVGVIDRIGEGIDVFLRSAGVRGFDENIRGDFASEADFVEPGDIDSRIDSRNISAEPIVASGRRDRVADRARRETAGDMEFVERSDLDADVGRFGVEEIAVAEDRRSDVADRARTGFAADDPFAEPGDFEIEVTAAGIEDAGLSQMGERRRAGRQFEAETPLRSVDPERDLTRMDDGFGLRSGAQRRLSAREFESEFDIFGTGDLDPETDIRSVDGEFGLAEGPTRQLAAADIDDQFDGFTVGPDDIELRETSDGQFEAMFEREVRR